MFKYLVVPAVFGLMVALALFYVSPLVYSSPDFTAIFASFVLRLSNAYFETMPSPLAAYIANLNLLVAASTAGLAAMLAAQLLMIIGGVLGTIGKWVGLLLRRKPRPVAPPDLTPIDMDPSYIDSQPVKKVQGRGFDTLDPD